MILEDTYQQSMNATDAFRNKAVLFIGSESYGGPTIAVLEGLDELGFTIYTIKKPNINSWFCNKIVEDPSGIKIDFVLSSLHWGTRWSYYDKFNLHSHLKVLIDGDDNHRDKSWRNKYARCARSYTYDPPEALKDLELSRCRWMEPLGDYEPDVVFTAQKLFNDQSSYYLPFGIHKQYKTLYEGKSTFERDIDFAHLLGTGGSRRKHTGQLIRSAIQDHSLPGVVYNENPPRERIAPAEIQKQCKADRNVHSYHRWTMSKIYFRTLNNAKVLIYPGVTKGIWDSKRPWEAYASGCLVLLGEPWIDMAEYPVTQVCEYAVYDSDSELIEKCQFLHKKPSFLDELRITTVKRAQKYFSPKPIANYFLAKVCLALREKRE